MDNRENVLWRRLNSERDDISSITRLLHSAYAELGLRGLNYTAVDQADDVTLRRLTIGITLLGCVNERIIATGTLYFGTDRKDAPSWYRRPDGAFLGQFAVLPKFQKRGFGSHLCLLLENLAREHGKEYIALDTAESASHLISFYLRLGYHHVDFVRWPGKTYRSAVMVKYLGAENV